MKTCTKCHIEKPLDEYYPRNNACKECMREYGRQYRQLNKEKCRKAVRLWHQKNRERHRVHLIATNHRRRARLRQVPSDNINIDELYKRDEGICGICNQHTPRNIATVDHIVPISRGGDNTWGNVQLAHRQCNCKKSDSLQISCGFSSLTY